MRSLWILNAVLVAALLLVATLAGVLIGVAFLALGVLLMFWPVGFTTASHSS